MKVDFFFQGKLSREEAASAFLATLLEQRADFREFFFGICAASAIGPISRDSWEVVTEENEFDILMTSPDGAWDVLIENKIKSGSVTPGQLVNYYKRLRSNTDRNILLVYLTPSSSSGQAEFDRLMQHGASQSGDQFVHISWMDDLLEFAQSLDAGDSESDFIQSGFRKIKSQILSSQQERYPLTGGRERVDEIVNGVIDALRLKYPSISFRKWRDGSGSTIYTAKSDLTLYLKAVIDWDEGTGLPFGLINDDDTLNLPLQACMNLSSNGRKSATALDRWRTMSIDRSIQIPQLGTMTTKDDGGAWIFWDEDVPAEKGELQARLLAVGTAILDEMSEFFS